LKYYLKKLRKLCFLEKKKIAIWDFWREGERRGRGRERKREEKVETTVVPGGQTENRATVWSSRKNQL